MNLQNLKWVTWLLALVPLLTGLIGLTGLQDPLYKALNLPADATLDSNLRFYSGVWFGLGLAAFWVASRLEHEKVLFQALWLMIFLGGLGRLISLLLAGMPFKPFIGFMALEVLGAPLFIYWHRKAIARRA